MDTRKLVAEAVGTFILVGMGSLSILSVGAMAGIPAPRRRAASGSGWASWRRSPSSGHISGGHFNPAVTLGALLDKRIDAMTAVGYTIAQVVGAIVASADDPGALEPDRRRRYEEHARSGG